MTLRYASARLTYGDGRPGWTTTDGTGMSAVEVAYRIVDGGGSVHVSDAAAALAAMRAMGLNPSRIAMLMSMAEGL